MSKPKQKKIKSIEQIDILIDHMWIKDVPISKIRPMENIQAVIVKEIMTEEQLSKIYPLYRITPLVVAKGDKKKK